MPTNNRAQMQKVAKRANGQENLVKRNRRLMTTDTHDDDRAGDGAQLPSQSSSDDGYVSFIPPKKIYSNLSLNRVMATIAQQMQGMYSQLTCKTRIQPAFAASMDKKKKEKEGKFLQMAQTVLNETVNFYVSFRNTHSLSLPSAF